jgi:hypothetical protein
MLMKDFARSRPIFSAGVMRALLMQAGFWHYPEIQTYSPRRLMFYCQHSRDLKPISLPEQHILN